MSKCVNCGTSYSEGDTICGACGKGLPAHPIDESTIDAAKEYALEALVDCDGNIFSAAKILKERFSIDVATSMAIVKEAFSIANGDAEQKPQTVVIEEESEVEQITAKQKSTSTAGLLPGIVVDPKILDKIISYIREGKTVLAANTLVDNSDLNRESALNAILNLESSLNAIHYDNENGLREVVVPSERPKDLVFSFPINEIPVIVRTVIVGNESNKQVGSVLARGAVGGLFLGPVGLLAGITGKSKQSTTFMIEYSNGKRETETVDNNSPRFELLCKYL